MRKFYSLARVLRFTRAGSGVKYSTRTKSWRFILVLASMLIYLFICTTGSYYVLFCDSQY
jgi:hypothetical protein